MKNEKGEAAFGSADDVLAEKTVSPGTSTTRENPERETAQEPAAPETPAGLNAPDAPVREKKDRKRNIIVAACIGLALLVLGWMCIGGFRKNFRR